MFRHQNAGRHNLMLGNKTFDKYVKVQIFGYNNKKSKLHS